MSKASQVAMLQGLYDHWACNKNRTRKDFRLYQAIRDFIIGNGKPEVTRGFVVNSARAMGAAPDALAMVLEEAGVQVKEAADD
jgi:cAMP phosphodiesterase